jgi:NAD(P)-dependent dehydrogenase (short-subunit alcohol dehydrogenase family)
MFPYRRRQMALEDKVALVTGAGRGMGRAIAMALAEEGASVALAEIDAANLEEAATDVRGLGKPGLAIQADVGDLADIDRMVRETVEAFGHVDILVNNAGITRYAKFMDVREEDWDRIHRVNAKGAFFCMQKVAGELIRQGGGGRIINIASIAGKGYHGTSNAAYAASKGAVISMTTIAAHQLGGYDINVNAICPGSTLTEMGRETRVQRAEQQGIPVEELSGTSVASIPIGRANEPEDIAAMAVFLAGPGARNITGQAFNVDGGLVMH